MAHRSALAGIWGAFMVPGAALAVGVPLVIVMEGEARHDEATMSGVLLVQDAQTIGSQTYLPIDLDGAPASHGATVANIVRRFRAQHPELRIIRWRVKGSRVRTFGIWIEHAPIAVGQPQTSL